VVAQNQELVEVEPPITIQKFRIQCADKTERKLHIWTHAIFRSYEYHKSLT